MRARITSVLLCLACLFTAVPGFAKTTKSAKKKAPARPILKSADYGAITDMAGGLLKSVAGSLAKELLFPSKSIDPDKLLADITANFRKELIAQVTNNDAVALDAARRTLRGYETEWKNGGNAVEIEKRVAQDSTINSVNTVFSRTGPSVTSEFVDPGLPMFVAAAQIIVSRFELRRQLVPAEDAAIRAHEIEDLEEALAHARNVMNRRRDIAMKGRLDRINECSVVQTRTHGFPWALITTYETAFSDWYPNPYYRGGGSQADDDRDKALARCDGPRRRYYDTKRREWQPGVDKEFEGTQQILELWAQTLDLLKRSQPPVTASVKRIDFGGMFGAGEGGVFANAVTGTASCAAGYTPFEIKGTYNVDWPAYYCGRVGGPAEADVDFGGMYGRSNDNEPNGNYDINNPITGSASCPAGFTASEARNQQKLVYCWRRHTAGQKSPYLFGGMFSDNGDKKNPITQRMLCPIGYTPSLVHGTYAASGVPGTRNVVICWAKEK